MPKIICPHCGRRIADTKVRCPFCRADIANNAGNLRDGIHQPVQGLTQPIMEDENPKLVNPAVSVVYDHLTNRLAKTQSNENVEKIQNREETPFPPESPVKSISKEEVFDWKQLQRYVLNSKPFELNGTFNNYTILLLDKLQLPKDESNLIAFAKDCQYLFTIRPNLHLGVRNSLLKKFKESILILEKVAPQNSELPQIKINFDTVSKFGVKNLISFMK